MRGYFLEIPTAIEESAMTDGCGRWSTFYIVVLPLVIPGLLATGVFVWIYIWSEFLDRPVHHADRRLDHGGRSAPLIHHCERRSVGRDVSVLAADGDPGPTHGPVYPTLLRARPDTRRGEGLGGEEDVAMSRITIQNARKVFGRKEKVVAVDDVSITIAEGSSLSWSVRPAAGRRRCCD